MNNLLDEINITKTAYDKYMLFAKEVSTDLAKMSLNIKNIPDENASVLEDGSLEIYVFLPDIFKKISFKLSPNEWAYK